MQSRKVSKYNDTKIKIVYTFMMAWILHQLRSLTKRLGNGTVDIVRLVMV